MRLVNFKITRGSASNITPDQIWAELGKVFMQRAAGLKQIGPAHSGRPQINVRELVASLSGAA